MNDIKNEIQFRQLNLNDKNEVEMAAQIHEEAPQYWIPGYKPSAQSVQNLIEQLQNNKDLHTHYYLLAEYKGSIIGFHWIDVETGKSSLYGHIKSLWVHEEFRKQKIATELKLRGEEWLKSKKIYFIKTSVHYENKKMFDFNIKLGFKPSVVEMTKDLKS